MRCNQGMGGVSQRVRTCKNMTKNILDTEAVNHPPNALKCKQAAKSTSMKQSSTKDQRLAILGWIKGLGPLPGSTSKPYLGREPTRFPAPFFQKTIGFCHKLCHHISHATMFFLDSYPSFCFTESAAIMAHPHCHGNTVWLLNACSQRCSCNDVLLRS